MELFPALKKSYSKEQLSARDAQRLAEFIAWGPMVFQASRLMVKFGILEMISDSKDGLTREEIVEKTGLSDYAVKCLLEASLSIGTVLVDPETDKFSISKTGWFLLNDPATRVNIDFNHDVNYIGMFHLEESLKEGKPVGLKHFGDWPTIYEGLSSLPADVQKSWFGFDQCVGYNPDVQVTILDLPQQIGLMQANVKGKPGAERISGYGINLLDAKALFPKREGGLDAIWMSQFLDCFSMDEIVSILTRAKEAMTPETRIYIMETLWDRQRFEPATLCLTMTSLYFTALANGNSKMYNTADMEQCIRQAGLEIEQIHDHLGQGHSIIVAKK